MTDTSKPRSGPTPDEAFSLLGDETRLSILRALWEAQEPPPPFDPVSFSDLRERVGVTDSGQFNYHLGKLEGQFVDKDDDGYRLGKAGYRVVRAVLSGAVSHASFDAVALDAPCPFCGGVLEASYDDGVFAIVCTDCPGLSRGDDVSAGQLVGQLFPPAGVRNRTPNAAVDAFLTWIHYRTGAVYRGVCPECSGSVAPSLTVCADHDAGGGFCEHCDGRYGVWLRGICENCKLSLNFPAWLRVLMDPRVGAFCLDHGVDVTAGLNWENWAALHEIRETVHATDPLDATVAFELDGETLTTRLGADFDVREVRRNS